MAGCYREALAMRLMEAEAAFGMARDEAVRELERMASSGTVSHGMPGLPPP